MTMKKSWFFFLLVLIACSQESRTSREKPLREVNYEGIFAIEIPEFLKPAKYLSDIAVLQYANLVKEFYVLVLMENKEKFNGITEARNLSESYPTDVRGYADFMVELVLPLGAELAFLPPCLRSVLEARGWSSRGSELAGAISSRDAPPCQASLFASSLRPYVLVSKSGLRAFACPLKKFSRFLPTHPPTSHFASLLHQAGSSRRPSRAVRATFLTKKQELL